MCYTTTHETRRIVMKLDIDKKAGIFRQLASATLYEVGMENGLDKHYKDATAVRNKVYQIYREVANEPEKYSVHPDTVELVVAAVSKRKVATRPSVPSLAETKALAESDIKGLTMASRDKAGALIHKKLEYIEAHPKALANESLVNLGKIFGILFDKSQIIQGQATEHVAVMSKLSADMTPDEALQAVLRSREVIQAEKYG